MVLVQSDEATAYEKFVKNNYRRVKKEHPGSAQVECMEILSQSFYECLPVQRRRKNKN